MDDLIDRLGKAKFITTLDLARGYWQEPMSEEAQPLTGFVTPFRLYQFRVMPFGLNGTSNISTTDGSGYRGDFTISLLPTWMTSSSVGLHHLLFIACVRLVLLQSRRNVNLA